MKTTVWLSGPVLMAVLLIGAESAGAAVQRIETRAPDVFGRQQSTLFDERRRQVGTVVTTAPDVFGRQRSEIRDRSGRVVARAETTAPDVFGRQRTVFRDTRGQVIGSAETSAPDPFDRRTTVFRDARRQPTGRSVSSAPDLFDRVTTRINGETPLDRAGEPGGRVTGRRNARDTPCSSLPSCRSTDHRCLAPAPGAEAADALPHRGAGP